jgi:hypothetical protein
MLPKAGGRLLPWGQRHPVLFVAGCSLVAFLACSCLPVWTAWRLSAMCEVPDPVPFWEMAGCVSRVFHWKCDNLAFLFSYYSPQLGKLLAVLIVGGWAGRLMLRQAEAGHAAEGSSPQLGLPDLFLWGTRTADRLRAIQPISPDRRHPPPASG